MQNDLNDVDSRIDVPFAVNIKTFSNPCLPGPENRQNLALLGQNLENFRSVSKVKPYSSSEPRKSVTVK